MLENNREAFFDKASKSYDEAFTNSEIGQIQRNRVWSYLNEQIDSDTVLSILELNCGTGEDACFLAKKGHHVLATDISKGMLQEARNKVAEEGLEEKVSFSIVDLDNLKEKNFSDPYDLIFSNFGGFNCLSPLSLKTVSYKLSKLLNPGGRIILVVMPKFSWVESLYFFAKLQWLKMFRRRRGNQPLNVNVEGINVPTWYYSPTDIWTLFKEEFHFLDTRPIGFIPSYVENFFQANPSIFKLFKKIDQRQYLNKRAAAYSDHFLIQLEKKS